MSAAAFVASLVSSLAWPGVVVAILVIFRRQFGTMLERLARVRIGAGGEGDQDWGQAEATVRQSLGASPPSLAPGAGGSPGSPAARPGGQPGAPRPPRALVEDRWQALTAELRDVVLRSGSVSDEQLSGAGFDQLMEAALRAGLLDSATVRSLDGLRHLRNLARTTSLSERQAQEFAVMADAVSYSMRRQSRPAAWPAS
jgi:hypothetical protein